MIRTIMIILFAVMSPLAVIVTVKDKLAAKKRQRRVPERALLLIGALGGSLAMLITMLIIRHKTRKPKFMVGLPVILAVHIILIIVFF